MICGKKRTTGRYLRRFDAYHGSGTLLVMDELASLEVVQYQDAYRLCYIRGPEGVLIGLAQELG